LFSGLYYDTIQNDIGAERAFLEANRFNVSHPCKSDRPPSSERQEHKEDEIELVSEEGKATVPGTEGEHVDHEVPTVQGIKQFLLSVFRNARHGTICSIRQVVRSKNSYK